MTITTKFNIGDIIFVPVLDDVEFVLRSLCVGEKYLRLADGRKIYCPECQGRGEVAAFQGYRVARFRIKSVDISVEYGNRVTIFYLLENTKDLDGRWEATPPNYERFYEKEIYDSFEEAEAMISKLKAEKQGWHEMRVQQSWVIQD